MKKSLSILFAVLATLVGLYPAIYFIIDRKFGLLQSKSETILTSIFWNAGFYTHIILGGLALLTGWTQFNEKIRVTKLSLHRRMGKVYVFSALLSALASLYIALFATGGMITSIGFFLLGVLWFYTTLSAYTHIKNRRTDQHQQMMIYSYAACFAAVTLRIWLPLLSMLFHDFNTGYRIVAYLCWVPNLIVAHFIVRRLKRNTMLTSG
jgi:uncharacterized membrane protein